MVMILSAACDPALVHAVGRQPSTTGFPGLGRSCLSLNASASAANLAIKITNIIADLSIDAPSMTD
ncbi:MAG: hypothetical protein INR70_14225 [Parafilimonas terrae]|nr:hypothetical protein [Parafilimonas terrae]